MMINPICGDCQKQMMVDKNGFVVRFFMRSTYNEWTVRGDKYKCPSCGHVIISNFGDPEINCNDNIYDMYIKE